MNYDQNQKKRSKKECRQLIVERNLPYEIRTIGQIPRLIEMRSVHEPGKSDFLSSRPIRSWTMCYQFVEELPYEKKEEVKDENASDSVTG